MEERGGREEQRVSGGEAEGMVEVDDDREHLYLGGTSVESAGRGVRSGEEEGLCSSSFRCSPPRHSS